MQKVIGLDIGSYSIKAVEIINTFKSYEVTNFYETVVPSLKEVPLDLVVPVCMEQLFVENDLQADRIITAMPGQFISSRVLSFNFSDQRKIQTAVMAELEDQVPFNMDDMIIDHQILGSIENKTLALAVMTRKVFLKNFLELLGRINIDPKLVDIDSLAFYNLSSHIQAEPDQCYALVDVGHEKTSVCIVRNNVLRMFRSINLGGRYITDFLARDLETSFHEAQRIKHDISRVLTSEDQGTDLKGRDYTVAERTTLAANAIVKELGRTLYAFKTWDHEPLSLVYLSGGTSRTRNFATFLSEQLEVPVQTLRLNETGLKINGELNDRMAIIPQSLAIGLRTVSSVKNHSQVNLRRGEFAYVQNYESLLRGATAAFKIIAFAMTLLIVSYVFKFYFYTTEIEALQEQYKKEFLTEFPEAKNRYRSLNVSFDQLRKDAETRIRQAIAEKAGAVEQYRLANRSSGPLRVLQEMSESIPKEVPIDVTLFDFKTTLPGQGKLVLRAETDNFSSQSAIIDALKKVDVLSNIEEKSSGAKPGTDGKVIEFTINANYDITKG